MKLLVITDIDSIIQQNVYSESIDISYFHYSSKRWTNQIHHAQWVVSYMIRPYQNVHCPIEYDNIFKCDPKDGHWFPQWKQHWESRVLFKTICYQKNRQRRETFRALKLKIPSIEIENAFDGVHFPEETVRVARQNELIYPDTILKTPGEIGCYTSHSYCWKKAYERGSHGWLFITEDDCECLVTEDIIRQLLANANEKFPQTSIVYFYVDPRYGVSTQKRKLWTEKNFKTPEEQRNEEITMNLLQFNEAYLFLGARPNEELTVDKYSYLSNLPQVGFVAYAIRVSAIPSLLYKIKENKMCALDYSLMQTILPNSGLENTGENKHCLPTHTVSIVPSVFKNLGDRYYGDTGEHQLSNGEKHKDTEKMKYSSIICPEDMKKFYETAPFQDRMKPRPLNLSNTFETF